MYFAMDEIGIQNAEKIKMIDNEADRWQFIYDTAKLYGFDGIHFTPPLYKTFNLDLNNIPDYFQNLKLTFHMSGTNLVSEDTYNDFNKNMETVFEITLKHKMHDISIHPPSAAEKELSLEYMHKVVDKWLSTATQSGISLSLETHVSGKYFLFDGLMEYINFINQYPTLGVLIDISHNYYDGYSEDEIIRLLSDKNIKGLHISDAIHSFNFDEPDPFYKGTHLAIGNGAIDFPKLLKGFNHIPNIYGALEIKASSTSIEKSLEKLKIYQRT